MPLEFNLRKCPELDVACDKTYSVKKVVIVIGQKFVGLSPEFYMVAQTIKLDFTTENNKTESFHFYNVLLY